MGAMSEASPSGAEARPKAAAEAPRRVGSAELLQGARRLMILHDGETYTLQVTRQNKLLLTK